MPGAVLLCFGSASRIRRFGERFRGGQYSLLFDVFLLTVPPVPSNL